MPLCCIRAAPSAAPSTGQASTHAESNLQKLRDLHDAGILSDEEFEAKKAQLEATSGFPG